MDSARGRTPQGQRRPQSVLLRAQLSAHHHERQAVRQRPCAVTRFAAVDLESLKHSIAACVEAIPAVAVSWQLECHIVRILVYKNKNQHRRGLFFQSFVQAVRRYRRVDWTQISRLLQGFADGTLGGLTAGEKCGACLRNQTASSDVCSAATSSSPAASSSSSTQALAAGCCVLRAFRHDLTVAIDSVIWAVHAGLAGWYVRVSVHTVGRLTSFSRRRDFLDVHIHVHTRFHEPALPLRAAAGCWSFCRRVTTCPSR